MRYIDVDKLHYTRVLIPQKDGTVSQMLHAAVLSSEIKDAPTVDVQEVRHGKWIKIGHSTLYRCSQCKRVEELHGVIVTKENEKNLLQQMYPFCHCGAKMDGEYNA